MRRNLEASSNRWMVAIKDYPYVRGAIGIDGMRLNCVDDPGCATRNAFRRGQTPMVHELHSIADLQHQTCCYCPGLRGPLVISEHGQS